MRRFKASELGESASRRVGYDFKVELAKSSKAMCRQCKKNIDQGDLRIALMVQDEEGYKSAHWTHYECFWRHREAKKLRGMGDLVGFKLLDKSDQDRLVARFEAEFGVPAVGDPFNATLAAALVEKAQEFAGVKKTPWIKAAKTIEACSKKITSAADARALGGIGPKIAEFIASVVGDEDGDDDNDDNDDNETKTTATKKRSAPTASRAKRTKK